MFNDKINRLYPFMDADDGGGGGATLPEPGDNGTDTGADDKPMTFDEMLASNPEFQKEFDRRQTKGINTAVTKERDRLTKLHNDQLTEKEKLDAMNAEEKRAYMDQKRQKELDEREAIITRRELEAEAKNMLADKKLPVTFAELLDYTSADTVKKGIEALTEAWAPAIEDTVNERLKGSKAPKDAKTEGTDSHETQLNEVRKFMRKH